MKKDIRNYMPQGGRAVKEDGSVVNWADGINEDGSQRVQLTGSIATQAVAVTPNDSTDLINGETKGIYVGGTGNIKVTLAKGDTVLFVGLVGGVIHPISAVRIHSRETTATNILAVY